MSTTLRPDSLPRYTGAPAQSLHLTDFVRDAHGYYRRATDGLGSRFQFSSHALIRAGSEKSPHERFLRFLVAGRVAGLPRSWMEARVAEVAALGSRVWRDAVEADQWLELRAEIEENECDLAEVRFRQDRNPENRAALVRELRDDAAAKLARAAGLEALA